MTIYLIDVSSAQGVVNWAAVDEITGAAWAKVSQGTSYANPYWPGAKAGMAERQRTTGLVPGGYLFLEQDHGAAQAQWFAQRAGPLDGFGLMLDAEPATSPSGRTSRPTQADCLAAVAELRHLFPGKPIMGYRPQWYWGGASNSMFDGLVASRYVTGVGGPRGLYERVPASWWEPYGGEPVSILQFTSSAVVPGVGGTVDCSAFRGSAAQYRRLVTDQQIPEPGPQPPHDWQAKMMDRLPMLAAGSDQHQHVRRAQALLGPAGARVTEDGIYGAATKAAVERVQRAHGMTVDGVVGRHTWALLVTGRV